MTPPALELPEDETAKVHLFSWMFFPNDEHRRRLFVAGKSLHVRAVWDRIDEFGGRAALEEAIRDPLVRAALTSPEKCRTAQEQDIVGGGMIAGRVLLHAIQFGKVEAAFASVSASIPGDELLKGFGKASISRVDKMWRKFRPVVHLWAAWHTVSAWDRHDGWPDPFIQLCHAAAIAAHAETRRAVGSRRSFLKPGETMAIPQARDTWPWEVDLTDGTVRVVRTGAAWAKYPPPGLRTPPK